MQKYIRLEGFAKSNKEAEEAVVQHLAEKYKMKKNSGKKIRRWCHPLIQKKHMIFSIRYMH